MAVALVTLNEFVTFGAGSQLPSPAWLATIFTAPAFVNVTLVPPVKLAGPDNTLKLTGRSELAVALRPSRFVAI